MDFTPSQRKALWTLTAVLALIVTYQWVQVWLFPPQPYDFSAFDRRFQAQYDSIQQVLQSLARQSTTPTAEGTPATSHSLLQQLERININTAPPSELVRLPRIGPALARRIVDYRTAHGPFQRPEDIMNVRGIGPKTFQLIRDKIRVR
ncbi:MAG: helix-hairpin-helix domain-containing protein [Calditrichaeota bacterium]|nr:helix-hairpin-helix domain-containing protein [Calditrichota bacterium]